MLEANQQSTNESAKMFGKDSPRTSSPKTVAKHDNDESAQEPPKKSKSSERREALSKSQDLQEDEPANESDVSGGGSEWSDYEGGESDVSPVSKHIKFSQDKSD